MRLTRLLIPLASLLTVPPAAVAASLNNVSVTLAADLQPGDDASADGHIDCGEFVTLDGFLALEFPFPGTPDATTGTVEIPFYGAGQTAGFGYVTDSVSVLTSNGAIALTFQNGCSGGSCTNATISYGTNSTVCPHNGAGATTQTCSVSFRLRLSRTQSCQVPVLVAHNDTNPGTAFDGNFFWSGEPGATVSVCTACSQADLAISKTDGGATVTSGGTVTYTLAYSNLSVSNVTATLNETVPANSTFAPGASSPGWVCSPNNNAGATCGLALGLLNAGASGSRTFAVTAAKPLPAGVDLTNTACIAGSLTDPNTANNCATDTTPQAVLPPDLALTKSCVPSPVSPGATLTCTLSYSNIGSGAASGATLNETVPANTTFAPASSSPGWACSPNSNAGASCTLSLGTLSAAASGSRAFAVTVTNPLPAGTTAIANTACASTTSTDPNSANNCGSTSTPTGGLPNLFASKTAAPSPVAPGGLLTYTISFGNTGNQGATAVVVQETVPTNTTFAPASSSAGWSCSPNNSAGASCTLAIGTVAAGASGSRTFAVTVANPLPAGTTVIGNTVCVDGSEADSTPANDCGSTSTPTGGLPNLFATKTASPSPVAPGGVLTYTIAYGNTGNQGATSVVLQETVPTNTTFEPASSSAGWVCSPNNNAGSSCTIAVGTVAAGATGNRTFAVAVTSPLPAGTTAIGNTVCVDGAEADSTPANDCGSTSTPTGGLPNLLATKTAAPSPVAPGGVLTYTIAYGNTGNQGATSVVLQETVPTNTAFAPASSSAGWACSPNSNAGSSCTLAIGTLAAGASGSRTFAVTVDNPLPGGTNQIGNTVCADATEGDADPVNDCGTTDVPTGGAPNLVLVKTATPAIVAGGGVLTYTLAYSNSGNQAATGLVLTENVPANTTFLPGSSTAGWSCAPNNNAGASCTLVLGALNVGASGAATFAVQVVSPLPPGLTSIGNAACADANEADQEPSNDCDSVDTPVQGDPDVALVKSTMSTTVTPGDTVVYTLAYSNLGQSTATGVVLNETVPAGSQFVPAASSPGWTCTPNGNAGSNCTLAIGTLAAGASGSAVFAIQVFATLPATSQIDNTACATTTGVDANPANDCGSVSTPEDSAPSLAITKTATPQQAGAGTVIAYTLAYSNTGNAYALNVVLEDTVPANTTFLAGSSTAGWSCAPDATAGSQCVLTLGAVAPGSSASAAFIVQVDSPLPQGAPAIDNTACLREVQQRRGRIRGGSAVCDDVQVPVVGPPADIAATKTASPSPVEAGQDLTYTITVTNSGDGDASDVTVTEVVPANTAFQAGGSDPAWSCSGAGPGSTCTLTLPSLLAHASATRLFVVHVAANLPAGTTFIGNTVCAGATPPDPNAANDCGQRDTPVGLSPILDVILGDALTDSDFDGLGDIGETVRYTAIITNTGAADALGLASSWPADTHCALDVGSVITNLGTVTGGNSAQDSTVTVNHGTLAIGGSASVTWTCKITNYPPSVHELAVQGLVDSTNALSEPSDDPDTPADDDPTRTPLDQPLRGVVDIPTVDTAGLVLIALLLGVLSVRRLHRRGASL